MLVVSRKNVSKQPMLRKTKCIAYLHAFILSAASHSASAGELSAIVQAGYDSNPFRLASKHDPEGSEYISTTLKGELEFSGSYYLKGSLNDRRYGSDLDDANNYKASAGLGFKERVDWFGSKTSLLSELNLGVKDKTYVSRLNGKVGESGGQKIEDRYDYLSLAWKSTLDVKWDKKSRTKVYFGIEGRDYEDLDIDGLSNYDYTEYTLGADWRYKFTKKNSIKFGVEKNYRGHDDKRERDLSGSSIEGTDLSYDGWQLSARYKHKLSKHWRIALSGQYDYREDSGSGYYDWERVLARAILAYKVDDHSSFKASISYRDSQYDKRADNASLDDEDLSEEKGLRYKLSYEKSIAALEKLSFVASARYDDMDADIEDYKYDRTQASLGLKYSF